MKEGVRFVSQLFTKLKEIKGEDLAKFLKGKRGKITLLVTTFVVVLAGFIFLAKANYDVLANGNASQVQEASSAAAQVGEKTVAAVLPETTRPLGDNKELRDPFSGALALKGVVVGGQGDSLAIIESGKTSFVAGVGTKISGDWTVKEIKTNSVLLEAGDQTMILEFNRRSKFPEVKAIEKSAEVTKETDKKEGGTAQ